MRTTRFLIALILFPCFACGGTTTASEEGRAPGVDPPTGRADALGCSGDARVTELARDSRPALPQVVTDGTFAYWSRRGPEPSVADQIVRAPLTGGPVEVIVSGAAAQGLAVDDVHVYWTERVLDRSTSARIVARAAKAGGTAETVIGAEPRLDGAAVASESGGRIVVDGDDVFFTGRFDGNGSHYGVFRAAKLPATVDVFRVGRASSYPGALAVDKTDVYWVAPPEVHSNDGKPPESALMTATKRGGPSDPTIPHAGKVLASGSTFEASGRDTRFGLAVDDGGVYWLSQRDGTVVKISKDAGTQTVLASDEGGFSAIAVGGGFVYWTWAPGGSLGGARRVSTAGGPVTTLVKDLWLVGVGWDRSGLVLTGVSLSRVTTCP